MKRTISKRTISRTLRVVAHGALASVCALASGAEPTGAGDVHPVRIDMARPAGVVRPLHGVNNGPLDLGETLDFSSHYRALGVPLVRLHDSGWPDPVVVDMSAVFPDLRADPERAESYRFGPTDDYVRAVVATGAGVVYRLGESIEHRRRKHRVMPPSDFAAWTAACIGIIRHYNDGWADGFRYGIRSWEIWNEPENRPAMWTGTDDDYFRLYATAARAIKARFPELRVGGPSAGATGDVVDGRLRPTPFLEGFLERCRRERLPLDFFSWHIYTNDPERVAAKALAIRRWLDERGFRFTESHLNEWNYLPDDDWSPLAPSGQGLVRERWFERMGGAEGAAYVAYVLSRLQDCPVDAANLYSGDSLPFGLFNRHGVPKKQLHAMRAFSMLFATPRRVAVRGTVSGRIAVCAGVDREASELRVLLADRATGTREITLAVDGAPWTGDVAWELSIVDAKHDLAPAGSGRGAASALEVAVTLEGPAVVLLRVRPRE